MGFVIAFQKFTNIKGKFLVELWLVCAFIGQDILGKASGSGNCLALTKTSETEVGYIKVGCDQAREKSMCEFIPSQRSKQIILQMFRNEKYWYLALFGRQNRVNTM